MRQYQKISLLLTVALLCPYGLGAQTEGAVPQHAAKDPEKSSKELPKDTKKKLPHKTEGGETITTALQAAYINNTELAAAVSQVNQKDESVVQAKAGYRPKVTGTMTMGASRTSYAGDQIIDQLAFVKLDEPLPKATGALEVSQNIYAGGATNAAFKGAENTVLAQRARLLVVEQTIFSQVIQAFLEIMTAKAEIAQFEGNVTALSQTLVATRDKLRAGEETRTSVAQAEAQLKEGEGQLEEAKARLEAQLATFTRLTGKKPGDIVIKPEIAKDLPTSLEQAIQIAMDNNPEIIQSKFEEAAAKYNVDRVGAGLLPTLDLVASSTVTSQRGIQTTVSGQVDRANNRSTILDASLRLTVPIYEQGAIRSQKREAHEAAAEKRITIETARRKVTENIITFWQNHIAAKANIGFYQSQVEARKVSLEGTREEMRVGTKILLDVLNAQRDLLFAQLNLIRAERTYFFEAFRLLGAMGRLTAKQLKLKVKYYDPNPHYQETKSRL